MKEFIGKKYGFLFLSQYTLNSYETKNHLSQMQIFIKKIQMDLLEIKKYISYLRNTFFLQSYFDLVGFYYQFRWIKPFLVASFSKQRFNNNR